MKQSTDGGMEKMDIGREIKFKNESEDKMETSDLKIEVWTQFMENKGRSLQSSLQWGTQVTEVTVHTVWQCKPRNYLCELVTVWLYGTSAWALALWAVPPGSKKGHWFVHKQKHTRSHFIMYPYTL